MKKLINLILFTLIALILGANNLRIINATRIPGSPFIVFSIAWDNSWYVRGSPGNHDAVWVFIKFRECGQTGDFNHALLSTNMDDHTLGPDLAPARLVRATDRFGSGTGHNTGILIRRKTYGVGDIPYNVCTLKVVGSTSGVNFENNKDYDVRLVGIEMVQIPRGAFWAGDGLSDRTIHEPVGYDIGAGWIPKPNPFQITSENAIRIHFKHHWCSWCWWPCVDLIAQFPKGYEEFYIMKYEITQGQYVDFLNTIAPTKAANRYPNQGGNFMHEIRISGGVYYTNYPDRPCNYLSQTDVFSFLDWAALRPMTDLEFEKAARGPVKEHGISFPNGAFYKYIDISSATTNASAQSWHSNNARDLYNRFAWHHSGAPNPGGGNVWWEVDLGQVRTIGAVATRGRHDGNDYVSSYKIAYRNSTSDPWQWIGGNDYATATTFQGNWDHWQIKLNVIPTISCRYFRFYVHNWNGNVMLRIALLEPSPQNCNMKRCAQVVNVAPGTEVCVTDSATANYLDLNITGGNFGTGNKGPLEAGIFARDNTKSRCYSGASFYGVMEMSGNLEEHVVAFYHDEGSCGWSPPYTQSWGDGMLNAAGNFDAGWPSGMYHGMHLLLKGGSFINDFNRITTSSSISHWWHGDHNRRERHFGGRGVR